ncbi:MAG: redoxin domain-containing protein [Armatimonadetes bacterium]|nr:redoxin domain-containing protein [Armatimonadota bacterium]
MKTATVLSLSAVFLAAIAVDAQVSAPQMAAPGTDAPAFSLPDADGQARSLTDFKGKYVVLEWTNKDCPYVVRHYRSGNMQATQKKATGMGAVWLTVVSSAPGKQGHLTGPQAKAHSSEVGSNATACLLDPDGKVGRAYGARNTPQIVVIDPQGRVVYHGAIDDQPNPRGATSPPKNFALLALEESMAGRTVTTSSTRPYGCNVKY